MNTKYAITIITVSGAVIAALINKPRLKDERDTINKDITIYKILPKESSVRKALLKRIDENIASSLINNRRIRRDIPGATTILIVAALGAGAGLYVFNIATAYDLNLVPDWLPHWLSTAAAFIVFGLVPVIAVLYLVVDIMPRLESRLRDENGEPVNEPAKHPKRHYSVLQIAKLAKNLPKTSFVKVQAEVIKHTAPTRTR